MKKVITKILTFHLVSLMAFSAHSEIFSSVNKPTHLRWNLISNKDDLVIFTKPTGLVIKSLESNLISDIYKEIDQKRKSNLYIKNIVLKGPDKIRNTTSLEVFFKSSNVEVFSFYKNRERKYIIDFWIDSSDKMNDKLLSEKSKKIKKGKKNKIVKKSLKKPIKKTLIVKDKVVKKLKEKKGPYRDIRYGIPFVWNYKPIAPQFKKNVSIRIKIPEYFYPIEDMKSTKTEEQKHMQLTINLYKKKKWGLMYKSIKLHNTKFGVDKNWDMNEYLKVNAILKDNLEKNNESTKKMAMNMLSEILQSTSNYEMRRGIYKYLSTFYVESEDYFSILNLAKRFYVDSKKNFDFEESNYAAELILNGLARLRRIDKVNALLKEKTIVKLLPKQLLIAYQIYTYSSLNENEKVIKIYNNHKNEWIGKIHEVILYNTAESYFRQSQFKKAISLYDQYLKSYSYHSQSGHARLRIALCYDFLNKNPSEIEALYKQAIDRSQNIHIGYEAKLRYVSFRNLRKRKINDKDREVRVFMDSNDNFKLNAELLNLKRLLRLRLFIVDKEYSKALAYLRAIPLEILKKSYQRTYNAEGGEIVNGIINDFYHRSQYTNVIKTWQIYKEKYINKIAKDPVIQFMVGSSYVKLGVYQGLENLLTNLKKSKINITQSYPIWFEREMNIDSVEVLFQELNIIKNLKLKNYQLAKSSIDDSKIMKSKKSYYLGIYYCALKETSKCVKEFERFLSVKGSSSVLDMFDIAKMFDLYTDALFDLGKVKRYELMSKALLKDSNKLNKNHKYMNKVREKIAYNLIEIMSSDENADSSYELEESITNFLKEFKSSIYKDRIDYLFAVAMIKNKKENDGIKMLEELINRKNVNEDIKELSRSELALRRVINQKV